MDLSFSERGRNMLFPGPNEKMHFFTNMLILNRRMSIKHRTNNKERIFFDLMKKNSKLLLSGNNWHPNLKYKMYLDTICSNRSDIYLLHMRIVSFQNFYMMHTHISFNPC
jgi:hypothetical protein